MDDILKNRIYQHPIGFTKLIIFQIKGANGRPIFQMRLHDFVGTKSNSDSQQHQNKEFQHHHRFDMYSHVITGRASDFRYFEYSKDDINRILSENDLALPHAKMASSKDIRKYSEQVFDRLAKADQFVTFEKFDSKKHRDIKPNTTGSLVLEKANSGIGILEGGNILIKGLRYHPKEQAHFLVPNQRRPLMTLCLMFVDPKDRSYLLKNHDPESLSERTEINGIKQEYSIFDLTNILQDISHKIQKRYESGDNKKLLWNLIDDVLNYRKVRQPKLSAFKVHFSAGAFERALDERTRKFDHPCEFWTQDNVEFEEGALRNYEINLYLLEIKRIYEGNFSTEEVSASELYKFYLDNR